MRDNYVRNAKVICGVEIDLCSEVDVEQIDDSFDHEFGTQHKYHNEVCWIGPVEIDGDLRWYVEREMENRGVTCHNRRWFKRVRQLELNIIKAVNQLDADSFWDDKELQAVADDWQFPEPDYDDLDD